MKYNISYPQSKVFLNNFQTADLFNCTESDKTKNSVQMSVCALSNHTFMFALKAVNHLILVVQKAKIFKWFKNANFIAFAPPFTFLSGGYSDILLSLCVWHRKLTDCAFIYTVNNHGLC